MRRALLTLLLGSVIVAAGYAPARAQADDRRNCFQIKGQHTCFLALNGLLLSPGCGLNKERVYICGAARALRGAPDITLSDDELAGGRNPGAIVCKKSGGTIVMGADRFGNQETFCRYDDKSMTNSASLAKAQAMPRPSAARTAAPPSQGSSRGR